MILEMRNINKYFPGIKALNNVTFNVVEKEIHAIVGENGAGKSTLMNILSGVYSSETYEGEISVVMFPSAWSNFRFLVTEEKALGFSVKVDKNSYEPKLICEKVVNPEELEEASFREIHFAFSDNITQEDLDTLKSFLLENNGKCQVFFHIDEKPNKEIIIKAAPQVRTIADDAFLKKAEIYPFVKSVWRE